MAFRGDAAFALRRLAARFRRDRLDDDLRDEIAQHIELRRQQLIDDGMDPREASYEARRIFGNPTVIREETRDMWSFHWIESLLQDTRFGARLLGRSPIFTLTAVASLAIGIGSAAAVFSLADGILFRTLPVRSPQELVLFRWVSGPEMAFESLNGFGTQTETESSSTSFSLALFESMRTDLADRAEIFAFADLYRASLSLDGRADMIFAQAVSGNYFDALGVVPAAGRLLRPDDDRADAPPAAVIGHDLWQRRLGGTADAIGRIITVNGVSFTVAGVLPRGFSGTMQVGQPCDVMVPMFAYQSVMRGDEDPRNPNFWWVLMMARLKPGTTVDGLQPASDLLLKQTVTAAMPDFPADKLPRMRLESGARGQTDIRDEIREPIQIMGGVVLALLLGAVTLALSAIGLYGLLAYAVTQRTPEIGVRIALGAERRQVRWMILRQSLVLVALGLLIGIPAAAASTRLLESLLFGLSPSDPRALVGAALVMTGAGLAAAYIPARRASRIDPLTALRME